MFGISITRREFSESLIQKHQLANRVTRRRADADDELIFWDEARPALIPIWMNGQLAVWRWEGWRPVESLRSGEWGGSEGLVPAEFVCDNGIWYVSTGIRCCVINKIARLISQPASHYYEVMTRRNRMPLFAGDSI